METKDEIRAMLSEIESWEADQRDLFIWEKIGRIPFKILDKLTPKSVQKTLGGAIEEISAFAGNGGRYLLNEKDVFARFEKRGAENPSFESIAELPVSDMDAVADAIAVSRAKFAAIQGATTGFGGIFTLAIDIPMVLGNSLKTIQEIAACYGYNPNERTERVFVVKCLQFSSSDINGKAAVLKEFSNPGSAQKPDQIASELQGWREAVAAFADGFGWKKLFQTIPVAGMIFGSYFNKKSIEDTAEAAKMLYKKRRLSERLRELESQTA